jgi:hypothetical protein
MRYLILFSFLVITAISNAQLMSGRLIEDERKLLTSTDFTVQDVNEGVVLFELAVNNLGKVTSAKLLANGTTVISTPTRIKVKNELMKWKFQEGTYYPEFHHVTVKITTKKPA